MTAWLRTIFGLGEGRVVGFHFDGVSTTAGCALLAIAAVGGAYLAYRLERSENDRWRDRLFALLRSTAAVVLVWVLLQPTLITESPDVARQRAVVLLDSSRSMGIVDDEASASGESRWDGATSALDDVLTELAESYELDCYTFDDQARPLQTSNVNPEAETGSASSLDETRKSLAQAKPYGDRSALGSALNHVLRTTPTPTTLLVLTDGVSNWGMNPIEPAKTARELGVQSLFVAIGGEGRRDVSISRFDMPDVIPIGEANEVKVHVQQNGFADAPVTVVLRQEDAELDRREIRLTRRLMDVSLSFTGRVPGQYDYSVEVLPLDGESTDSNNVRIHKAKVVDHKPRVLLVDQRPRWEWRFALAGLRRDRRVGGGVKAILIEQQPVDGAQGGRGQLFINSFPSDMEALTAFDVLVVGDLPLDQLPPDRMQIIERFVRERGGGLVVLPGPRHCPNDYFGTTLGNMLPVVDVKPAVEEAFAIQPAPTALGRALFFESSEAPTSPSGWTSPVLRRCFSGTPHPMAEAVAVRQAPSIAGPPSPVILIRRYGRGRVLYLGSDDFWRLRGPAGGDWHNRFWIQAVIQTGMPKILGGDAHLELKPGKRSYFPGEQIEIAGEAFAKDYSPSEADAIEVQLRPAAGGGALVSSALTVQEERPGHFSGQILAPDQEGSYVLSALDPVSDKAVELCLQVAATGPELESTRADRDLLDQLASSAGGLCCDLNELPEQLKELRSTQRKTLVTAQTPMWTSPWLFLLFAAALGLTWWRRGNQL